MDGKFAGIPLEVISKGRSVDDVLSAYMDAYKIAEETVDQVFGGESEAERFAKKTQSAVYRIYLLGVQDGMKQ